MGKNSPNSKRVVSIMPKELVEMLGKMAQEDKRTVSQFIVKLVDDEVKRREK
jgi:hypothetical protein